MMETRRSFFGKLAAGTAAFFSFSSLSSSSEKVGHYDESTMDDVCDDGPEHYYDWANEKVSIPSITNAKPGDLFMVQDTGEVVMALEGGELLRGFGGTENLSGKVTNPVYFIGTAF
jgi:hypothetical protein